MQNFNYHTHTYRCGHSDLDMNDEEYIKEFIKMGFEKIAFTDHCPEKNKIDKRENMRMEYSQKDEYLESIDKLKEKYSDKIQIEKGYEVEYLPGEESNIMELKNECDKIILGQHFIYDENNKLKILSKKREKFTDKEIIIYAEYIENAMKLGIPNIIAHPDIYMLNRDFFGDKESEVANNICKSAEKYNIPLEINLNNIFSKTYYENRKFNNDSFEEQKKKLINVTYPCKEFWNIVSKFNIKVLYGIDAHHKGQISLWNELIELANEIIGNDIINKLNFINI